MSKWKENDIRISSSHDRAMQEISDVGLYGRQHVEFGCERLCSIVTHAQYELKILLKDIKLDVDNNEHEDETSKHIKRSFKECV